MEQNKGSELSEINALYAIAQAIQNDHTELYSDFVPTWTSLTVGNGTVEAKYIKIGKFIHGYVFIRFGSTTAITGNVSFSLPEIAAAVVPTSDMPNLGILRLFDSGTASYHGTVKLTNTTTARFGVFNAAGTYLADVALSATVPHTWAVNDEIYASFAYRAGI